MNKDITGYELSRQWFNYCFENPEKVKPNHTALYFFCIEHCNRLGWKEKFGLPTTMVKEAIGISSYKTYINTLNDLIEFGFVELVQKSKNQYSSNIIALVNFTKAHTKAHTKALDKALIKHIPKQVQSTYQSIDSIIKQITNKQITIEQLTKEQINFLKNFLNENNLFEDEILKEEIPELENSFIPKQKNKKLQEAADFYFLEYSNIKSDEEQMKEKYKKFIDILFGDNEAGIILSGVLSINNQVKYEQFIKLYNKSRKVNKSLETILTLIENTKKYHKDKKNLYLTIYNTWLKNENI